MMEEMTDQTEEVQGQEVEPVESDDIFGEDILFDDEPEAEEAEPVEEVEEKKPEPPADLPAYWSQEEKDTFSALPAEAQDKFLKLEKSREAFTTRKSQELSELQRKAESLGAVGTLLEQNPEFRQYVANFGRNPQQQEQPAEQPLPEDPIEALKEQAKREAKAEIMAELGPQFEQQRQVQGRQAMEMAISGARSDPDFQAIDVAMGDRIAEIARTDFARAQQIRQTLLSDPIAYQQAFSETKKHLSTTKKTEPTKKTVTPHAPRLQGRGAEPQTPRSKKQRMEDAQNRLVASGGRDGSAIGDILDTAWGEI